MPLKGYHGRQKVTPKGPDQASLCDKLGVRMRWSNRSVLKDNSDINNVKYIFNVRVKVTAYHILFQIL